MGWIPLLITLKTLIIYLLIFRNKCAHLLFFFAPELLKELPWSKILRSSIAFFLISGVSRNSRTATSLPNGVNGSNSNRSHSSSVNLMASISRSPMSDNIVWILKISNGKIIKLIHFVVEKCRFFLIKIIWTWVLSHCLWVHTTQYTYGLFINIFDRDDSLLLFLLIRQIATNIMRMVWRPLPKSVTINYSTKFDRLIVERTECISHKK